MRKLKLYLKHQTTYLLFLVGVFVLPLALYLQFSPYRAPKIPLVVLGALVISQYAFHKEKVFRKKHEDKITAVLKNELGRVPSRTEVIQRTTMILQFRGFTIVLTGLFVFALILFLD